MSAEAWVLRVAEALRARGACLVTAESCTGGLIAAACTSVAGSSEWFERGFVTYSNAAKQELLGVEEAVIQHHGAVSRPVVLAMAAGALARSPAHWVVAVTGIAGPGGGTADKPVGTVWIATAGPGAAAEATCFCFSGDRAAVRQATVVAALEQVLGRL